MREWVRRVPAIVVALALLTASAAFAQTSLATVRGKVADEQGGMLPGATVTARQIEADVDFVLRVGAVQENVTGT